VITHNSRPLAEAAGAKLNLDKVSMPSPAGMCHQDKNPARTDLEPRHRHELHGSAISDKVIDGRGYRSVLRTDTDLRHRNLPWTSIRSTSAGYPTLRWIFGSPRV